MHLCAIVGGKSWDITTFYRAAASSSGLFLSLRLPNSTTDTHHFSAGFHLSAAQAHRAGRNGAQRAAGRGPCGRKGAAHESRRGKRRAWRTGRTPGASRGRLAAREEGPRILRCCSCSSQRVTMAKLCFLNDHYSSSRPACVSLPAPKARLLHCTLISPQPPSPLLYRSALFQHTLTQAHSHHACAKTRARTAAASVAAAAQIAQKPGGVVHMDDLYTQVMD